MDLPTIEAILMELKIDCHDAVHTTRIILSRHLLLLPTVGDEVKLGPSVQVPVRSARWLSNLSRSPRFRRLSSSVL